MPNPPHPLSTTKGRDTQAELRYLRRRLAAARKRAAYWSGRPSARGFGFNPCADNGRNADLEYEMAIDDCRALADQIAELTGKRPVVTDYKDQFRKHFAQNLGRILKTPNKERSNEKT